jgi:hypothetical protein
MVNISKERTAITITPLPVLLTVGERRGSLNYIPEWGKWYCFSFVAQKASYTDRNSGFGVLCGAIYFLLLEQGLVVPR